MGIPGLPSSVFLTVFAFLEVDDLLRLHASSGPLHKFLMKKDAVLRGTEETALIVFEGSGTAFRFQTENRLRPYTFPPRDASQRFSPGRPLPDRPGERPHPSRLQIRRPSLPET